jgi:hypothetical protein
MTAADPWALVEALNEWALRTDWVDWVELGGSLGRGAGDEFSDVDAGIGVREPDRPAGAATAVATAKVEKQAAVGRESEARGPEDAGLPVSGAESLATGIGTVESRVTRSAEGEEPQARAAESLGSEAEADEGGVSDVRVAQARSAIESFAPVAASLTQPLGEAVHLVCVYEDGRQLSLVVFDAAVRTGLPPQALATVDKSGRLGEPLDRSRWDADDATVREWTFLAWMAIGDAARHRFRGRTWRAMKALTDARDNLWQLWAHELGLVYPQFGAVTVENADSPLPPGIEATHPRDLSGAEFRRALTALAALLDPYTAGDLLALAESARGRLALLSD